MMGTVYRQNQRKKNCGVFLPFLSPKMMLHGVVFSTTFQEFFVLAKLKILSNLVERFKFYRRLMYRRLIQ